MDEGEKRRPVVSLLDGDQIRRLLADPRVRKAYTEAADNLSVLLSCNGHVFELPEGESRMLRCCKCGGKLSRTFAYWYTQGVEHGRSSKE